MPSRKMFLLAILCALLSLTGCKGDGTPEPAASPASTPTSVPTSQPTATANLVGLNFAEIPEQIVPRGESFLELDAYNFLRLRRSPAEEMTWSASGGEHIGISITNGVITATPLDASWIGSETVHIEACEPAGTCVTQEIAYSVLDRAAFSDVQVTYVGNSGFLISVGDQKVLIDAISDLIPLSTAVRDALVNAAPPFDNIDLILVTHSDTDHFNAAMVQQHMQNDPGAIFISTTQAASQLTGLGERVIAMDPVAGTPARAEADGIQVEALYLSHGYPINDPVDVFNNGYVVTIGGTCFFHTGDTADLRYVLEYNLVEQNIDLAFILYFYLQDNRSRGIITENIGADYLFPIHYQSIEPGFALEIQTYYPDAIVFYRELENWFLPLPGN